MRGYARKHLRFAWPRVVVQTSYCCEFWLPFCGQEGGGSRAETIAVAATAATAFAVTVAAAVAAAGLH